MKESDLQDILEAVSALERLTRGDLQNWRSVLKDAASLWDRCPFALGDRVRLIKTPEITLEKSWGWRGSKHFLVDGATAKVVERQFYEASFVFGLHFDDETWVSSTDGSKRKPDRPAMYMFSETWLDRAA
jgi:hypothetical protein